MKVAVTTLIVCVTSLVALGLVMLYSSSMTMVETDGKTHVTHLIGAGMVKKQLCFTLAGLVACAVAALVDLRFVKRFAWVIFAGMVFMSLLVFLPRPIGVSINGAHRWFHPVPGLRLELQPSEFLKLGLVLVLAWYCDLSQRKMTLAWRGAVLPLGLAGVALGAIFFEPDRGTSILLAGVSGILLIVAGTRWQYLLVAALLGGSLLAWSITHDSMRMGRIKAWNHPEQDQSGKSLQGEEAKIALGSGGLFGKGLGNGIEKHGYLPEIHSDFIFANVGEELGLAATLPVLLAYALIMISGWHIAAHARDPFGCLLALGLTALIGLEALINVGVVTTLLPNKGLALPFISAGGSSMLAMLTAVGLLLGVARQAEPERITASDVTPVPPPNPFAPRRAAAPEAA